MQSVESYNGRLRHKLVKHGDGPPEAVQLQKGSFSFASLRVFLTSVFLPQGYPESVSDDYLSYQVWDTVQAFASSMTSALSTEAVLKGAGVGNKAASALAASLTWLVKDGLGMIGRISFTYFKGTDLDANPKKWRLVADIFNDIAFCLDLSMPYFPGFFLPLACCSSLFRCVVGVAGGATRTAVTQHQARRNNLADVAAKDGSQETLVNVAALIASLILLPLVSGLHNLIWSLFVMFTVIHLYANFRAVRSLHMESLNRNRATIAISKFLYDKTVPTVINCNELEPLFYSECGSCSLGCSLKSIYDYQQQAPDLLIVKEEDYVLAYHRRFKKSFIAMSASAKDQLRPFFHLQCLRLDVEYDYDLFDGFCKSLDESGYDRGTLHFNFDGWSFVDKSD